MKKNVILFIMFLIISGLCQLGAQEISFKEYTVDDNFAGPAGIWIEDIDMDGDKDIISCNIDGWEVAWWKNMGGSPIVWEKYIIDSSFQGGSYVFVSDIDDDGKNDVLGSAWYGNEIAWWKNEGEDPVEWTKYTIDGSFHNAHEVCAFDVDKDGKMDILGAAALSHDIAWWKNLGGNPVQWEKQIVDGYFPGARSVDAKDIDGDGDIDIAGAALTTNEIAWWRNDGNYPIEWTKFQVTNTFYASHKVQLIDFDGDQDIDILGTAYTSGEISCWKNLGGNPIDWEKEPIDQTFPGAVIGWACHIDADEILDVVGSAQGSHQVAWWKKETDLPVNWQKHQLTSSFTGVWPLYWGDIDGDKDIDLAAGGNDCNQIKWWENTLYGAGFGAVPASGNAPLNVQFDDQSNFETPVVSWEWDFNNDGTIDSYDANPSWAYDTPGSYTINLKVTTDSLEQTLVKEDYIRIFNGESALEFNGENSFVNVASSPGLNIPGSFTLEAWINPYDWGEMQNVGFGRIVDKNQIALYLIGQYSSCNDSSVVLQIKHTNGTISKINTPIRSINLNEWQHIAAIYNGVDEVVIHINGQEMELNTITPPSGEINDNTLDDLYLGNNENMAWTFEGCIDEVRIWDNARSKEEIESFMNMRLTGFETGLIGYWQMNEGNGEMINDNTGGDNSGTLHEVNWTQGAPLSPHTSVPTTSLKSRSPSISITNSPNPFSSITHIEYTSNIEGQLIISVYALSGTLVRDLVNAFHYPGNYSILWNGNNEREETINPGIYICMIQNILTGTSACRKIIKTN